PAAAPKITVDPDAVSDINAGTEARSTPRPPPASCTVFTTPDAAPESRGGTSDVAVAVAVTKAGPRPNAATATPAIMAATLCGTSHAVVKPATTTTKAAPPTVRADILPSRWAPSCAPITTATAAGRNASPAASGPSPAPSCNEIVSAKKEPTRS